MVDIHKWIQYLNPKVNKDLYVWGAQGQDMVTLLPDICQMAGSLDKVDKILTLMQKRLLRGYSVNEIDAFDCSGLFMKFAIDEGLFQHDMTANGIYNSIPEKVDVKNVQIGDFLFYGSLKENPKTHKKEWSADHIGYVVDDIYAIEARGSAYGVVKTLISDRGWERAARPYWWSGIKPTQPTLYRELYLTEPMMRGDDVKMVQDRLSVLGFSCGKADGVFGTNTEQAVEKYQKDSGLNVKRYGVVGKKTAEALGFRWEG